uniref:NSUN5/RCM1 N-terminal domain-containing protein n=1 Tax=Timema tahoe TaxID=61484 RepID=A0A7R9P1V8_9NEOP|nr:unnamed protein product [Timema tahoe]
MSDERKTAIRVPKLYIAASKIAKAVKENGKSLKQLVFSDKYKHYNIKGLYGLVSETLSRGTILDILLEKTEILTREEYLNKDPWIVRVLVTELLWRKKRLLSGASRVQTVLLYEPKLKAELKTAEDSNFNVLETGDM